MQAGDPGRTGDCFEYICTPQSAAALIYTPQTTCGPPDASNLALNGARTQTRSDLRPRGTNTCFECISIPQSAAALIFTPQTTCGPPGECAN